MQNVVPALLSESLKASFSLVENAGLNRVGASTEPCLTPGEMENAEEVSPLSWTLVSMSMCSCHTIMMNSGVHLYLIFFPAFYLKKKPAGSKNNDKGCPLFLETSQNFRKETILKM